MSKKCGSTSSHYVDTVKKIFESNEISRRNSLKEIERANEDLERWKSARDLRYRKNDEKQIQKSKERMDNRKAIYSTGSDEDQLKFKFERLLSFSEIAEIDLENDTLTNDGQKTQKSKDWMDNRKAIYSPGSDEDSPTGFKFNRFLSFSEAAEKGCTEEYRKSLIGEMDHELEKMKIDGFIESDDVFSSNHNHNGYSETDTNLDRMYENVSTVKECTSVEIQTDQQEQTEQKYTDEHFGQDTSVFLSENPEEYFLEAYNRDGDELVMAYVQIVRKPCRTEENDEYELVVDNMNNEVEEEQDTSDSSKRNTMYSNISRDSCFSEKTEGDEIIYENLRTETLKDDLGNIRIERFSNSLQRLDSSDTPSIEYGGENTNSSGYDTRESSDTISVTYRAEDSTEDRPRVESDSNNNRNNNSNKNSLNGSGENEDQGPLKYIFDEILTTEKKYVSDLRKVVRGYKPFVEDHRPQNAIGNACYIFGNIELIYRNQKKFLKDLEGCPNIKCIVQKFIEHENLFKLYPQYFKNKPKADATLKEYAKVVTKRQEQLNDKLDISAYLLTPLQRLAKYKLFLENIKKKYEKSGERTQNVEVALEMIRNELQNGNDLLAIESIIENPIEKFVYGSFVRRERFTCLRPSKPDVVVFLFKEIIILTYENQNNKNIEEFHYWKSIKMSDLRIATYENDLTIHLTDFSKNKRKSTLSLSQKHTIILEAKDERIKETWTKDIENILWRQLEQVKTKLMRQYQKNPKTASTERQPRLRVKSTGSSIFYTHTLDWDSV